MRKLFGNIEKYVQIEYTDSGTIKRSIFFGPDETSQSGAPYRIQLAAVKFKSKGKLVFVIF